MGSGERVLVIAEAGVNHNGDMELARAMIDTAARAGADIVKFQAFRTDGLAAASAPQAAYQKLAGEEPQRDMLRRLELDPLQLLDLKAHCAKRGIRFLCSAFDPDSLRFLVEDAKVDALKLGSGELTDGPLLLGAARSGRPVILSTGMASLDEVREALAVLAFGYIRAHDAEPSMEGFAMALASSAGKAALKDRVTLLHCVSRYPAPVAEANLRAMDTLGQAFGLAVGFSDHTPGIVAAVAAAARGARVIEKHFTLDKALPGPDHAASLDVAELGELIAAIRAVESALGDGRKECTPGEAETRAVVRKSLVARRPIAAGEVFSPDNLVTKRPGGGISPMCYWELLGRRAGRAYAADEAIGAAEMRR